MVNEDISTKQQVILIASTKKSFDKPTLECIQGVLSKRVIFIHPTTSFYYGILLTISRLTMPSLSQKLLDSPEQYSKPFSILKCLKCFTILLLIKNLQNTLLLYLGKCTQTSFFFLESFNLQRPILIIVIYYQTKTPIGF